MARLDPPAKGSKAELLGAIESGERDADRALLVAGGAGEAWTELCLREADVVVAFTSGEPDREWSAHTPALRDCELLVVGGGPASDSWLTGLEPRELQVITDPNRLDGALDSTARRLTGRAWGIVFSGGGARAFAHLGVIEELVAAGLRDRPRRRRQPRRPGRGGCGHGGGPRHDRHHLPGGVRGNEPDWRLRPSPLCAAARPPGARPDRRELGEQRIEELPMRFFCVSCDLVAREAVVHRTRACSTRRSTRAWRSRACSRPSPRGTDGLLVDGGVLDNLPVATMAGAGEGPVIASDVTGRMGRSSTPLRAGGWRSSRAPCDAP